MKKCWQWVISCFKKSSLNRESEIEILENQNHTLSIRTIQTDLSINVCICGLDEILSPMYESNHCNSPSFRLSFEEEDHQ